MNHRIRVARLRLSIAATALFCMSGPVLAGDACLLSGTDAEQGLFWGDAGTNIFRGKITHQGNPTSIRVWSTLNNIRFWPSNTLRASLSTSLPFALKTSGGSWGTLSDRRLKKEIRDYSVGMDTLLQVQPRTFKFNGRAPLAPDDGHDYIGVVAQELQPIAPSMVSMLPDTPIDGQPALSVDPSDFIYMLTNAVKQQASEIQALKVKTALLENLTCRKHPQITYCSAVRNRGDEK